MNKYEIIIKCLHIRETTIELVYRVGISVTLGAWSALLRVQARRILECE